MKWMWYASLGCLSLTKKFVRTANSTGAENKQAVFFRIYRVVNKTGFGLPKPLRRRAFGEVYKMKK
jgi:hypothetical protein